MLSLYASFPADIQALRSRSLSDADALDNHAHAEVTLAGAGTRSFYIWQLGLNS